MTREKGLQAAKLVRQVIRVFILACGAYQKFYFKHRF